MSILFLVALSIDGFQPCCNIDKSTVLMTYLIMVVLYHTMKPPPSMSA